LICPYIAEAYEATDWPYYCRSNRLVPLNPSAFSPRPRLVAVAPYTQ